MSPLFAPVLFDGDSTQATRPTNNVSVIDELTRHGARHGNAIASVICSAVTHELIAAAGGRHARTSPVKPLVI